MTLQDAQHKDIVDFPALPVTPVSDAATVNISDLPTDHIPAAPVNDEAAVNISDLPTDHVPVAPIAQAETPAAPVSSEISGIDDAAPTQQALPGIPGDDLAAPASSEIIVSEDLAPASPPDFPTAAPSIFTAPPPFPPVQPQKRKRPDTTAILSLCAAFLLLILSAGGLVFDLTYYRPYQVHTSATATAYAAPTITAHAAQTQIAYSEQTSTAQQQATATAYQTIYTQATSGRPFTNDPLKHQSDSAWDENQWSDNSSCAFKHGSYEVSMPDSGYFLPCFAESSFFTDFAIQVTMNIRQGDEGGVIFRGDSQYGDGYIFLIDTEGLFNLYTYTDKSTNILSDQTGVYQTGQTNQLTIIAIANKFYFYLNQHFLATVTDKTFGEGMIGLIADDHQQATTVDYNNLKVWLLP